MKKHWQEAENSESSLELLEGSRSGYVSIRRELLSSDSVS